MQQLIELTKANAKEILRTPGVLFWGMIFPMLMSLGLGIAFTQKSNVTRNIAVVKSQSANFYNSAIDSFLNNRTEKISANDNEPAKYKFTIENKKLGKTIYYFQITSWDNAIKLLKRGKWDMIINEKNNKIDYHFDPLNSDAQLIYLNLSQVFEHHDYKPVSSNEDISPLTIKGTRYIDFFVPGLIAMGIMMSSLWGLSYGTIERRSKKLLRRMVATPMKKSYFLISIIIVRTAMNFIEGALLFLFTYLVFDITIQGSLIALFLIFIAGNAAFAGISIFASSRTSNTEVGNGLINVVSLPMMVLSGIFFSYQNFPGWTIPYIKVLPLTLLSDGIRGIFIEGNGVSNILLPFLILSVIGIVFFGIGLKMFKWH